MKTENYRIWKKEEYSYPQAFGFIPKITAYLHEDREMRPCMLIVPGGGYFGVSPTEGELVALKFYEMGYQTFVLTYTTNMLQITPLKLQPLKDISRSVRLIRSRSDAFGIREKKVVVCGFSAGAHLCGSLCVHYMDMKDDVLEYAGHSNRPDAAILCYPVITSGEKAHRDSFNALLGKDASADELEYMSLEKQVTQQTPPCFVWATATDELVPVENSELYVTACRKKNVPCALHIFSSGKHGLSLADEDWANGIGQNPYTAEQLVNTMAKIQSGEITAPAELLAMFEEGKKQEGKQERIPNMEAAVWPELAEGFLRTIL